ncbi:MAG: hypothetical protein FJW26_14815, partial [Acidimicrobiia bacterium]|nr:hypothetical protein [Acidimicrobiia bacterium]
MNWRSALRALAVVLLLSVSGTYWYEERQVSAADPISTPGSSSGGTSSSTTIDRLQPNHGVQGDDVTISGSNFGEATSTVKFGDVPAEIKRWTDSQIVTTIPKNIPGVVVVMVTTAGGSTSTKPFTFDSVDGKVTEALSKFSEGKLAEVIVTVKNTGTARSRFLVCS